MRKVMIKCPQKGIAVPTGVEMDQDAFGTVTLDYELKCPACGAVHHWTKKEAFLEQV